MMIECEDHDNETRELLLETHQAIIEIERGISDLIVAIRAGNPPAPHRLLQALLEIHSAAVILACALDVPCPD
jgi:hypothetical protein